MPEIPRFGDLELSQDLAFQRREWIVQRIGWAVLVAIVLAALAGLLGKGPLSSADDESPDGRIRLQYDRYLHFRDPTTLMLIVSAGAGSGNELRVRMNREYLEGVQIERITPEPQREEAGSDEHAFIFAVDDAGEPAAIVFHLNPDAIGSLSGDLRVGEAAPLSFSQFVYP